MSFDDSAGWLSSFADITGTQNDKLRINMLNFVVKLMDCA